ncbi:gliotoxin biosynthesis protein GliK [Pochonia chlamydosporia 170]|uniref:gamma-glutamylcyclotransferase n=1 Tax=Pochonia chlamydosporia 170 TaxID=1380566 RepID=A0A179F6R0_METCM|nr:gliotoxin biosynthesis protein GliK [Pochonia chlamydosporia 170]OAQ61128.2 gliotoxin biosynthesis protein GliK [Pochonia chlamydosporia 170]
MADPATTMTNDETAPAWKLAVQAGQPMWYIGYGSNMKGSSMKSRSITPLATEVITVPTHYVTFDIFGVPYSEPCYASIAEFPHNGSTKLDLIHSNYRTRVPALCGVAHLLTLSDFHRLLVTEGSGVVYDIITVQAYRLDNSRKPVGLPFTGYTLKAKWPQRPNGIPSARYMRLFIDGAKENKFGKEYIEYLENFPAYHKVEGPGRTYGQLVFDLGWRPFLKRLIRLTTWNVDKDGNCPVYIAFIIVWLYKFMWFYHDRT